MHSASDGASERSRNFFLAENDMLQGRHVGANFPKNRPLLDSSAFLAALPGAERRDCAHPPAYGL